ncbi:MAG TPA: kelch repeat-containing protein [Terracidiphilus sp.]|nr:kelch repeat-containing protein [Terracidiphilus sp.]
MRKHRSLSGSLFGCLLGFVIFSVFSLSAAAQTTAAWTWMGGSSNLDGSGGEPGVYGTLGTPAPGNIPASRWNAVSWTDGSGNLWLLGGTGYEASSNTMGVLLNDFWEFSPSTNEWTWMGGSSPTSSQPGVWGTLGTPAQGNFPGGRSGASGWTDGSGNLWLFGGWGSDANGDNGSLNDLWEFSPVTNEWAWMGGSSTVGYPQDGRPGVYGTLGSPAQGNVPGGRAGASSWTDSSGNFWFFGGTGYDANGKSGYLNDLWEFSPSTNEWTWMGGSSTLPAAKNASGWPGVYGTLGSPAAGNIPGSRIAASTWTGSGGNLWLFGGSGYDSQGNLTALNDLWEFSPATKEWAWMGGSSTSAGCVTYQLGLVICGGQPGVYGAMGTPAAGNIPGGRAAAASWIDGSGNFWLFGGQGYDSAGASGNLNDLWEFDPSTNQWAWMGGNTTTTNCMYTPEGNIICRGQPGAYGVLGTPDPGNDPGGRLGASIWIDTKGSFWLFGGYGADSTGGFDGALNDLWEYQQNTTSLPAAATPTFNPAPGTYAATLSVTVSSATANATIYYTTDGSAPTTSSTVYNGPITILAKPGYVLETIHAMATASGYSTSAMASATYTIELLPGFSVAASPTSLTVAAGQSATTTITLTTINGFNSTVSFGCSGLPSGATCSFNPQTVTPSGAAATTTLTVNTSATTAALRRPSSPLFPSAALAAVLCCFGWKKRRRLQMLLLLAVCGVGLSLLIGCGGGSSTSQSTTYTVTVNATSGSLQQSTTFSLTVN